MTEATHILSAIEQGDPQAAERLLPLIYDELRKLAAQRLTRGRPDKRSGPLRLPRRDSGW